MRGVVVGVVEEREGEIEREREKFYEGRERGKEGL